MKAEDKEMHSNSLPVNELATTASMFRARIPTDGLELSN